MIELSLNEVETLTLKAARGAGLEWGEAEDAALAARWLARHGFDWSALLEADLAAGAPALRCGLRLADHLRCASGSDWARGETEACLPWQLAFLAVMSRHLSAAVEIGEFGLWLHDGHVHSPGSLPEGAAHIRLRLRPVQEMPADLRAPPPAAGRPLVPNDRLDRLNVLAESTSVPNSAKSRLRGARERPAGRRDRPHSS
ncbi:MAG: DUF3726 domain-containing protein [Pikeienuella sp.]